MYMGNVDFEDLKAIIEYIYKGEVNIAQHSLQKFLKTAVDLQVSFCWTRTQTWIFILNSLNRWKGLPKPPSLRTLKIRIYQRRHPTSSEKMKTNTLSSLTTAGEDITLLKSSRTTTTFTVITIERVNPILEWTCRRSRINRVEKDVKFQAVIHPRYQCILPYRDILLNPRWVFAINYVPTFNPPSSIRYMSLLSNLHKCSIEWKTIKLRKKNSRKNLHIIYRIKKRRLSTYVLL